MAIALDNTIPIQARGTDGRGLQASTRVARVQTTRGATGQVRRRRVGANALAFAGRVLYFGVLAPLSQLARAFEWSSRRLERFRLFV